MALDAQQTSTGAYVPNTFIFDVSQLYSVDVTKPEFKELLVRLYQNVNLMCNVLNLKDTGMYLTQELVNSQSWFQNPALTSNTPQVPEYRQVYRLVVNYGPLPDTTETSQPHNLTISNQFTFTRIYACASDTTGLNYIPIPYASSVLVENISLRVDNTNVYIKTGSNRSNFNICYVVLEYIKL